MYRILKDIGENPVKFYDSLNDSHDQTDDVRDQKICSVYGSGNPVDFESMRSKIKDPKYACSSCGRSASEASSLCSPKEL
jgi:hypothetical protein